MSASINKLLGTALALGGAALAIGPGLGGANAESNSNVPALAALSPPPIPGDNPQTRAKVELGKLLFFDPRLSGDALSHILFRLARASVTKWLRNDPVRGWSDNRWE